LATRIFLIGKAALPQARLYSSGAMNRIPA
jgi:hypothetical protein